MSARPRPETLPPDELDLLLSRRIDGDLSAEESAELDAFLAASPVGRARLDSLQSVVSRLRSAPAPAASFALSTRVFSRVLEGSGAVSGLFHRFGIAPKMGYLFVLMASVCLVAVGLFSKTRPAATVAGLSESAPSRDVVSVFIPSSPAPPAAAPAAAAPAVPAPPAKAAVAAVAAATADSASAARANAVVADASIERKDAAKALGRAGAPSQQSIAPEPPAFSPEPPAPLASGNFMAKEKAEGRSLAAVSADTEQSVQSVQSVQSERSERSERSVRSSKAAAAEPARAAGGGPVPSISLLAVGGGTSPWKLTAIPGLASLHGPLSARYRLTITADGRVAAMKKLSASPDPLPASVESLLRDLRLERIPGAAAAEEIEVRLNVP